MAKSEETSDAPEIKSGKQPTTPKNVGKDEFLFSPRFRSVAAMAGWDEEALMVAAFIVEDTPERQMKGKKRSNTQTQRTPPSDSRRKRRAQGRSPLPIPVSAIHPDEDIAESKQEFDDRKTEIDHVGKTENLSGSRCDVEENLNPSKTSDAPAIPCIDRLREERKQEIDQVEKMENSLGNRGNVEVNLNPSNITDAPAIPCIDKLREELSCAICLEICYEPSTTPCGHSFCRKCLLSAADKCGRKCPKCRNLISNGRYSTVNTVLWNTIQLLFPQEVEARKATSPASDSNEKVASPARITRRNRFVASLGSPGSERNDEERGIHRRIRRQTAVAMRSRIRTGFPDQDEDAALAFRLQREEFLEAFRERGNSEHRRRRGYPEELKAEIRKQLKNTMSIIEKKVELTCFITFCGLGIQFHSKILLQLCRHKK